MWAVGLVIGAMIGAMGGVAGAFLGAVAGAGAGWAFMQNASSQRGERVQRLEAALSELQQRVRLLENDNRSATRPFTPEAAPPELQVVASTVPPVRDVEPAAPAPASILPVEPVAELNPQPSEPQAEPVSGRLPPSEPPQPSALWNFFFGGNTLVRFGVIVLFFGVAFLLKYASENIEIPIEARLVAVALGAIVMLAIGWRLRQARPGYGLIMQGGGIGVLYLTIFAAFRIYQLLPGGLVFVLLAAMAVFSAMLAVLQNSRSLAAMGISGGFLAPILASTGGGSHVGLFSYYALLNLGILLIAWFKPWRVLNLLGFLFTLVIALAWGERYYRSEHFASTEPFLILFFLFYVAIAVLFTLRQDASVKNPMDGALVFGVPLVGFGLQAALVRDFEYGSAFSALAVSAVYLLLAKGLFSRAQENVRMLVESFLALGVVFGTLAIPLALDGRWTAATWALEGAAIVWVGVRQEKFLTRCFGYFLLFASGVAFAAGGIESRSAIPVLNSFYLGSVMIAVAALFAAWLLKYRLTVARKEEATVALVLFGWGCLWWLGGGLAEIEERMAPDYRFHAALAFITLSCAGFSWLHRRIDWSEASYAGLALLPLLVIGLLLEVDRAAHPFVHFGFVVWPLAITVHMWILRRHDVVPLIGWWHVGALWLAATVGSWELAWWLGELVRGGDVWRLVGWPLVSLALVAWLSDRGERLTWPVARHARAYLLHGAIVLAAFLWLWMLHTNLTSRGDPTPLPYLPLLNPLDIAQGAALLALATWFKRLRRASWAPPILQGFESGAIVLGSITFVWLNGVLLRTLHHWAKVPFDLDAMMRSTLVQTSFSIFWSALALCAMVGATRMCARPLWLIGAGLMALVVAKLFFVDLSNIGGIERIVSFLGVGVLMLVVGYFSPVPPAREREAK